VQSNLRTSSSRIVIAQSMIGLRSSRMLAARASLSQAGAMRYLPAKVVDEMGALHLSDPGRWTAAALATRYGAPSDAASAAVTLSVRRQRNGRASVESCTALAEQWARLAEPGNAGRRRSAGPLDQASVKDAIGRAKETSIKPRFAIIDDIYDAVLKREQAALPSVVAAAAENDESTQEAKAIEERDERTEVQRWADALIAEGSSVEAKRKVSYLFSECGVPHGHKRAVWVRDGPSGMLRAASNVEREHLTGSPQNREQKPRRKV
jgi:hypothetical protein